MDIDQEGAIADRTRRTVVARTRTAVAVDGDRVVGAVSDSDEALRIKRSFDHCRPPTQFCRECRGGPTLASSVLKQVSTVALDVRDRIQPRKAYKRLRERLN